MKVIVMISGIITSVLVIGWIGLQAQPQPFSAPQALQSPTKTAPIPAELPAAVKRFYRARYGDQVPVIDTVVIAGRGRIRRFGIWLPARYLMVHNTGRDYRHYFEATFFGFPFLKINEGYVDGQSFFESPTGAYYNDPNSNQGANLALWAEGSWFPSLWVTNPRAKWEAVDDNTALLRVPFENQIETFVVRFNPTTGLVDTMEAMRFKAPEDTEKVLWITGSSADGAMAYATWLDEGKPWIELSLEQMVQNMDIREYIRARGH